jgi:hypothetical protein
MPCHLHARSQCLQDSRAPAHHLAPALSEVGVHKKVGPGAMVALQRTGIQCSNTVSTWVRARP